MAPERWVAKIVAFGEAALTHGGYRCPINAGSAIVPRIAESAAASWKSLISTAGLPSTPDVAMATSRWHSRERKSVLSCFRDRLAKMAKAAEQDIEGAAVLAGVVRGIHVLFAPRAAQAGGFRP